MPRRRVNPIPDIGAAIPRSVQHCAYQTAGIVLRIPELQRHLRHYTAAVDLCGDHESEEVRAIKRRADTLKQEITQGISSMDKCELIWPNTERLIKKITKASWSGRHDIAYKISKDLMAAAVSDLTSKKFVSEMEKKGDAIEVSDAQAAS